MSKREPKMDNYDQVSMRRTRNTNVFKTDTDGKEDEILEQKRIFGNRYTIASKPRNLLGSSLSVVGQ